MQIKKMNVNVEGLNRFFGPLEAKIMDILWSSEGSSIKEVQTILNQETAISVNTVMTVMNRLLEKGHLTKAATGIGRARVAKFVIVAILSRILAKRLYNLGIRQYMSASG